MDDKYFEQMLNKAKLTSQKAFASILNYLKPQIYSYVLSRYPAIIRDDAFQEASIRLHKYISTFPYTTKSKLFSMFVTIANQECLRILNRKAESEPSINGFKEENGLDIAIETTIDIEAVENDDILIKVYRYIERKCSEIDKKRYYLKRQGFSNEIICRILGIPSSEVQSIYQSIYRINCTAKEYLNSIDYL